MDFSMVARKAAQLLGSAKAFLCALLIVIVWAVSGPFFKFSTEWNLAINSATTIITFLAVFLLQNSQSHDTRALHIKLDEVILKMETADNDFAQAETKPEKRVDELDSLHKKQLE